MAWIALARSVFGGGAIGWPFAIVLGALAGAYLLRRTPRVIVIAVAWSAGYLAYEISLGYNVDPGVYLVYLLPPLAVLAGVALHALVLRLPKLGVTFGACLSLAYAAQGALAAAPYVPPDRAERFKAAQVVEVSGWMRAHLTGERDCGAGGGHATSQPIAELASAAPHRFRAEQWLHADAPIPTGSAGEPELVSAPRYAHTARSARARTPIVLYDQALLAHYPGFAAVPRVIDTSPPLTIFQLTLKADPASARQVP